MDLKRRAAAVLALLVANAPALGALLPSALPAAGRGAASTPHVSMQMTQEAIRRGMPIPSGPDPYKLVAQELDFIKSNIKSVLRENKGSSGAMTSNEVLTMAAREFMERKGKSFRPMLVLLVGHATDADFGIGNLHYKLAVITEMIHTASLIHADVLEDDGGDGSSGTLVHQEVALDVGNKVCILAGDFLLAKAAVELSLLDSSPITQIVSRGLESVCEGGMMTTEASDESRVDPKAVPSLDEYLAIQQRGTAQLIGNSCQCSAILSGHEADSLVARACLLFGESLAMAQQLVAEADAMEQQLRRCRRNPRKWPDHAPPTAPLLAAAERFPELRPLIARSFEEASDAAVAVDLVSRSDAVARTQQIATEHTQSAVDALEVLPSSATRDAMVVLCHKILAGSPLK